MTSIWIMIAALALSTAGLKVAGPLALGGRPLPVRALDVVELLASALLAALVVAETFGKGGSLTVDARVVGAAFAAVAVWPQRRKDVVSPPLARQSATPPSRTGRAFTPAACSTLAATAARGPDSQIVTTGRPLRRPASAAARAVR